MNVAVYTTILGGKDDYAEPMDKTADAFILSSDTIATDHATFIRTHPFSNDPRRVARHYKLLPHSFLPTYDAWVWLDGSMNPGFLDLAAMAERVLANHDIAVLAHPERCCLYDEGRVVLELGRDTGKNVTPQLDRYRAAGMPSRFGLAATGILFRRCNADTILFNDLWHKELDKGSVRDQISFPYIAWKTGIRVNYLPWPPEANGIRMRRHNFYDHDRRMS